MNKYRKKPVVIEAIQFTGENQNEILQVTNADNIVVYYLPVEVDGETVNQRVLVVHTLEGAMTVSMNDWVIKGIKGEFYPCKPDIFDASYEPADQEVTV